MELRQSYLTIFLHHFPNAPRDYMFPYPMSVLLSPVSRLQIDQELLS